MTYLASELTGLGLDVPEYWPTALHPRLLARIEQPTPYLVCDLETVADRYRTFTDLLPEFDCYYALKCNSSPEIVVALDELGAQFEVASFGELEQLIPLGIAAQNVLHSNPVKPPAHVAAAYAAGVWRFAFDSEAELYKLARHAPGSAVYLRVRVDDSSAVFPLSHKFGAEPEEARGLFKLARRLGLTPYGATFHVGSQCTKVKTWRQAVAVMGQMMSELQRDRLKLEFLNISGGFPARYEDPVPPIEQIADTIYSAMDDYLPYIPTHLAAEPGRYLVAESSVIACGVIGREVRAGESWIYLDVGAYNGLIETKQTRQWRYPLWSSRSDHGSAPHDLFTVTGPTCDSSDTLFVGVPLPSTIDTGDVLYIGSGGAYTLSYASSFNGFPPPTPVFVGQT